MPRNTRGKSVSEDGDRLKKATSAGVRSQDGVASHDLNSTSLFGNKSDKNETADLVDCQLCAEEILDDQQRAVMCQKCNSWTHQSCANLNNQEMKALDKGRHNLM